MTSNAALRRISFQQFRRSNLNSSTDQGNPNNLSISNIFKPTPKYTTQDTPLAGKYYVPCQLNPTSEDQFVPFIQERDKMNRLLSMTNKIKVKKSSRSNEMGYSGTPSKTKDTVITLGHTPKENKLHLTRLLSLEQSGLNDSGMQISTYIPETDSQIEQGYYSQFKLNIPKSQKACVVPGILQKSACNSGRSTSRERDNKQGVVFLKTKRSESSAHLRTQSNIVYPSVGHYNTNNADVLKPRMKNVVISKRELERNKATPLSRESHSRSNASLNTTALGRMKKSGSACDFAKQTNRANVCIETQQKEAAKAKLEEIEANIVRNNTKKMTKTRLPQGVIVNSRLPYEINLVEEVTAKMRTLYNLSNSKASHVYSSRVKKIKNIDPRTIEEAWVRHFS